MNDQTPQSSTVFELHGLLGLFGLPEPEWFDFADQGYRRAEWQALGACLIIDIYTDGRAESYVRTAGRTREPFGRNVLRHSCMTGLQSVGCPIEVRAMIAGHSTRNMTSHYSHDELREPIQRFTLLWTDKVLRACGESSGESDTENAGGIVKIHP